MNNSMSKSSDIIHDRRALCQKSLKSDATIIIIDLFEVKLTLRLI